MNGRLCLCSAAGRNLFSSLNDKNYVKSETRKCKDKQWRQKGEKNITCCDTEAKRTTERIKTKQETEKGEKKNHLTPLLSRGQSCCKLDIKTQIVFRRVTPCQKILDTCREQTTIPISSREIIFSFSDSILNGNFGEYAFMVYEVAGFYSSATKGQHHIVSVVEWGFFSMLKPWVFYCMDIAAPNFVSTIHKRFFLQLHRFVGLWFFFCMCVCFVNIVPVIVGSVTPDVSPAPAYHQVWCTTWPSQ